MNRNLQIQKLLACSDEFNEFQEVDILIESPFVQETADGVGVRQVFMGLASTLLLIADQELLDYRRHPDVVFGHASGDPDLEGLELVMLIPLSKVKISSVQKYKLVISCPGKPSMHFELCNCRLSERQMDVIWDEWVKYVRQIRAGIPLGVKKPSANPPRPNKPQQPFSSFCCADDAVRGYTYSGSRQYLHDFVRSMNTTAEYHQSMFHPLSSSLSAELAEWSPPSKSCHSGGGNSTGSASFQAVPPELGDCTSASSIVTRVGDNAGQCNKNNGANNQLKASPVGERRTRSHSRLENRGGKRGSRGDGVDGSASLQNVSHNPTALGRRFIRSSSIVVRSDGSEEAATHLNRAPSRVNTNSDLTKAPNSQATLQHASRQSIKQVGTSNSRVSEKNPGGQPKHKGRSTYQIMKEKFGYLESNEPHDPPQEANVSRQFPYSPDTRTGSLLLTVDEVSLSLNGHPYYTENQISDLSYESGIQPPINAAQLTERYSFHQPPARGAAAFPFPAVPYSFTVYNPQTGLSMLRQPASAYLLATPTPLTPASDKPRQVSSESKQETHQDSPAPNTLITPGFPERPSGTKQDRVDPQESVISDSQPDGGQEIGTVEASLSPHLSILSGGEEVRTVNPPPPSLSPLWLSDQQLPPPPAHQPPSPPPNQPPSPPRVEPAHLFSEPNTEISQSLPSSPSSVSGSLDMYKSGDAPSGPVQGQHGHSQRGLTTSESAQTSCSQPSNQRTRSADPVAFTSLPAPGRDKVPEWMSKHLPAGVTPRTCVNNELVNERGQPVWLSKRQQELYEQLTILRSLDDDLAFQVYSCQLPPPSSENTCSYCRRTGLILTECEIRGIIRGIDLNPKEPRGGSQPQKPKRRWNFLNITHKRAKAKNLSAHAAHHLTHQVIELLEEKSERCHINVSIWNPADSIHQPPAATCYQSPEVPESQLSSALNATQSQDSFQRSHLTLDRSADEGQTSVLLRGSCPSGSEMLNRGRRSLSVTGSGSHISGNQNNNARGHSAEDVSADPPKPEGSRLVSLRQLGPSRLFSDHVSWTSEASSRQAQQRPSDGRRSRASLSTVSVVYDSVLLHYPPEMIARELTLIDRGLFIRLEAAELLPAISKSHSQQVFANPSVMSLIKFSERIHHLFISELLRCQESSTQIDVLNQLLLVAHCCLKLKNYNSVFNICGCLNSHPLQRLRHLWLGVKKLPAFRLWSLLLRLTDPEDNYRRYFLALNRVMKVVSNEAHLPYFGLMLSQMLDLCTDSQSTPSRETACTETEQTSPVPVTKERRDGIDLVRRRLLLHQLASVHYDFQSDVALRHHLLQTAHSSPIRNYTASLRIQGL